MTNDGLDWFEWTLRNIGGPGVVLVDHESSGRLLVV